MKKVITSFILIFILVLFGLNNIKAEEENVEIKSIKLEEKSDNVSSDIAEDNESNYNMDLELFDIDDYVTYKIIVKNNSDKDYVIDNIMDNLESDYIESSYTTNKNELKKGKEIEVYLTLKYKKLISIKEETFDHNLIITLNYTNGETSTISDIIVDDNPNENIVPSENTGINTNRIIKIVCYIIIIISIILLIVLAIIRKKKLKSLGLLLLLFMISMVYAEVNEEKCTININVTLHNSYTATFKTGREVNLTMMKLAGASDNLEWKYDSGNDNENYYYDNWWYNENVISIENATEEQYNNIKENLTNDNIVSIDTSEYPIYMWFEVTDEDNQLGSIYWYTDAGVMFLNADASYMFYNLRNVKKIDLSTFDTSKVNDMCSLFSGTGSNATTFEIDLTSWNTSSVTNMKYMFAGIGSSAEEWDIGDLSNWDVSNVTDMSFMFRGAGASSPIFDIDLTSWDVSSVTNMRRMFSYAGGNSVTFAPNLSTWDVSNVTDMNCMFYTAGKNSTYFDLDLSDWRPSNVVYTHYMFSEAGRYAEEWSIGDLSGWDVSNVTYMERMFEAAAMNASEFNLGDLSNWNTARVTSMLSMFNGAGYNATSWYIGSLSNWNVSSVRDMNYMFSGAGHSATSFQLDLSRWKVSGVNLMNGMFSQAGYNATEFNIGDLSNWRTSNQAGISQMFYQAGYNATEWYIGSLRITTSNVSEMFKDCPNANATLYIYNVSTNSWDYRNMFSNAATASNARVTVNYSSSVSSRIDNIINTRSSNSNVVKGSVI